MPKLVNADKVAEAIDWLNEYDFVLWNEIMKCIDKVPEVDAVPVVRCDDCIYRDGKTPGQPNILCWQMHVDDFCSYGTKREVGTYCEDIVSVVRCKDCKYFNWWGPEGKETFDCFRFLDAPPITPDFYCAWGEKREDIETNGHWYKQGDEYRCSKCGDTSIVGFKECPNCGAKMEMEEDDCNLISNRKCSECLHVQNITGLRKYCHDCEAKMGGESN